MGEGDTVPGSSVTVPNTGCGRGSTRMVRDADLVRFATVRVACVPPGGGEISGTVATSSVSLEPGRNEVTDLPLNVTCVAPRVNSKLRPEMEIVSFTCTAPAGLTVSMITPSPGGPAD